MTEKPSETEAEGADQQTVDYGEDEVDYCSEDSFPASDPPPPPSSLAPDDSEEEEE